MTFFDLYKQWNDKVERLIVDSMKNIGFDYSQTFYEAQQGRITLMTFRDAPFDADVVYNGDVIGKIRLTDESRTLCPYSF